MQKDPVTDFIDSISHEDEVINLLHTLYEWNAKGMNVSTWIEHANAKLKEIQSED